MEEYIYVCFSSAIHFKTLQMHDNHTVSEFIIHERFGFYNFLLFN